MGQTVHFIGNNEHEKLIEVIGYVIALGAPSEVNFTGQEERQITFSGITRDGDQITIIVSLKSSDYVKACKARKDGIETKLSGTITKIAGQWIMSSYTDFFYI